MPIGVPIEYPKAPNTKAGLTIEVHFLLVAMATAVPGPPMAALLAVRRACKHLHLSQRIIFAIEKCLLYLFTAAVQKLIFAAFNIACKLPSILISCGLQG